MSRLNSKGLLPARAAGANPRTKQPRASDVAGEEPIVSGMAGRYALALFELARDADALDAVNADLDRFDAMIAGNPDLLRLVRSPVFGADEQGRALSALLARAQFGELSSNFLKFVAAKRRLFAVRDMIRAFGALVASHKGEVTARVTVAERLDDRHLAALKDALASVTGKDVELDIKVDASIIGGLIVQVGSRMVDTSLKTKLNSLKHAMKEVG